MATSSEQIRAYTGPALLSFGFRPFFLFGALWAAITVAIWLPVLSGYIIVPSAFDPLTWHSHELLFGYVPAIVAGFLLTAIPNWTGRLPIAGVRLGVLFGIWVAGRIVVAFSAWTGAVFAALVDLSFLVALIAVIGREIVAGRNTRNLKVLLVVGLLFSGNLLFHFEVVHAGAADYALRLGIGAVITLIMLIGGRIVPSFTRNWLARRSPENLPAPFGRFDVFTVVCSVLALAGWVMQPDHVASGALLLAAGVLNFIRLGRWAGVRTGGQPLVLILHVAYAFVPLGFLLAAAASAVPDFVGQSGALHGWTVGAIGLMTLAVMTRASLGHTGAPLHATKPIQAIYLAALISALARIITAFDVAREPLLIVSAVAWVAAFAGFVVCFGPKLMTPRR